MAFKALRRDLSDEEIKQSGVTKILLDELYQAEARCDELKPFVARFYAAHEEAAVLRESRRQDKATDFAQNALIGIGGLIFGLAPSLPKDTKLPLGAVLLGAAIFFSGVGIWVKRR